jgi:hypothetical protein
MGLIIKILDVMVIWAGEEEAVAEDILLAVQVIQVLLVEAEDTAATPAIRAAMAALELAAVEQEMERA